MLKVFLFLISLTPTVALAQQAPPAEQALANKLTTEINANLQCQAALIVASKELEELRKRTSNSEKPNVPPPPTGSPPK